MPFYSLHWRGDRQTSKESCDSLLPMPVRPIRDDDSNGRDYFPGEWRQLSKSLAVYSKGCLNYISRRRVSVRLICVIMLERHPCRGHEQKFARGGHIARRSQIFATTWQIEEQTNCRLFTLFL